MDEQSWLQIAKELGLFTIFGGLITVLLTQIFAKYFNRQVEQFKSDLRHQYYRLERLHEKRSEVVVNLYKYIVELEVTIQVMTAMIKPGGDDFAEKELERINNAGIAYNKVRVYFTENEILFPQPFCEKMNSLLNQSIDVVADYKFYIDFYRNDVKLYKDILHKVNDELPSLKEKLKHELRRIMKVESEDATKPS